MRSLASIILGLFAVAALAADEQAVQAPYVEPGDCWTYRGENMSNRGPIDAYELCVTFVDPVKNVILAFGTVKNDGREIDTTFSAEWNPVTTIVGLINAPAARFYKYPLHVGDTYTAEFEFRDVLKGANAGKHSFNMKVVGWESITVPAGTFRALKLEGRSLSQRYDRPVKYPAEVSYWYVPEVHRHVKYHFKSPLFELGEELMAFRLKN
jgi:hypothetical protein